MAVELQRIKYARDQVQAGIVHLGVGAFHRAHQAVYWDTLLPEDPRWGVCGINLRAADRAGFEALQAQGGLYTLKTLAFDGATEYRQVGAIVELIDASRDYGAAVARAADDHIQIISMTVTESGYYLDEADVLRTQAPDVAQGLAQQPTSCVYTYLHGAMRARMAGNGRPITLMSCDNLRENGHKLRTGFLQYLKAAQDEATRAWVEAHVSFPCSMVDRITPRLDPAHARDVRERFGIEDQVTIMAEPYIRWVIEDNFAGARPPLDRAGAIITRDVQAHEEAKIRVLNGGHTALAYLAALRGHRTFDRAMTDPELADFFMAYETEEVIPGLGESPIDLAAYRDEICARFSNASIGDTVARICSDGASKMPIFIRPTAEATARRGLVPHHAIRIMASWYVFMRAVQRGGEIDFAYVEPSWDTLVPLLAAGQETTFATHELLWGDLPQLCPTFVECLVAEIAKQEQAYQLARQ
ncbi:uncharacterized protein MONBRDRAFT_30127 [Monosiga brevicollis MX1]|uniref:mannitol 2-dehydrogenase n=1 Tax=Monosiga brevicollis TaxID=81824 RepID=A9VD39_MONBE|nr:uncharacterized protein MONBRDRAFT_30127 [Monosiga brevicollis MX1]EDQ84613.1 predicted protein [Monosiga brevicollis MX1]|eukprot:XP_001750640.1 hypothetical protein [Monosiga brevicollis MX1]